MRPVSQQPQQGLSRPSLTSQVRPVTAAAATQHTKGCQTRPKCESKMTQSRPVMCDQSTQLDNMNDEELISSGGSGKSRLQIVPVPVPVHVPLPMYMYQAPLPVPILVPVPIPVPVVIPTTKKTYDRVQRKIRVS